MTGPSRSRPYAVASVRAASPFGESNFDEQLYLALRNSPWWMVSIALHVLAFFVLMLLGANGSDNVPPPASQTVHVETPPEYVTPEDNQDDEPVDLPVDDVKSEDPIIAENPNENPPEADVDEPFDETFGEVDDAMATQGEAINPNADRAIIGIGAGTGTLGRRGRGGDGEAGGGRGQRKRFNDALDDALEWLAAHQSPDGRWEAAGFGDWCDGKRVDNGPGGKGKAMYDVGVTGTALCAFLGAGYTHRGKSKFARVVGRGLRWLKKVQDAEGCFGPRSSSHYIYNHATASLAIVEAYAMTGSAIYKSAAQRALDFIALTRNPYFAWRYGIRSGQNDTSVTGWMMMALKSASILNKTAIKRGMAAPLVIDESSFEGVTAWLDKMTDPDTGRVGYITRGGGSARAPEMQDRFPVEKTESTTAVGVLARIFSGEDPKKSKSIRLGAELMARCLPTWNPKDGSIDMYYWYYGTLAAFQCDGNVWRDWSRAMDASMIQSQRRDTDYCQYKGSWDPIGPWGADGGRVYSTALMAMCLEVYYRYDRVFTGGR